MPLARTASMTASTFFSRARALALRVTESFQGVFLFHGEQRFREVMCCTHQSKPLRLTPEGLNAPNMAVRVRKKVPPAREVRKPRGKMTLFPPRQSRFSLQPRPPWLRSLPCPMASPTVKTTKWETLPREAHFASPLALFCPLPR